MQVKTAVLVNATVVLIALVAAATASAELADAPLQPADVVTNAEEPASEPTATAETTSEQTTSPTTNAPSGQVSQGAEEDCDPAYPDFCIPPPPPDLNCDDSAIDGRQDFTALDPDPHELDGNDNDGVACESGAGTAANTTSSFPQGGVAAGAGGTAAGGSGLPVRPLAGASLLVLALLFAIFALRRRPIG